MTECKLPKKNGEEKDDLQYMNVDATEPMDEDGFDDVSASFLRLDDPAEEMEASEDGEKK